MKMITNNFSDSILYYIDNIFIDKNYGGKIYELFNGPSDDIFWYIAYPMWTEILVHAPSVKI